MIAGGVHLRVQKIAGRIEEAAEVNGEDVRRLFCLVSVTITSPLRPADIPATIEPVMKAHLCAGLPLLHGHLWTEHLWDNL